MPELPAVDGVLSAGAAAATVDSIAAAQESSGAIPWYPGGHVDPWDHVESAMALSVGGRYAEAEHAYEWSARTQRSDGSWPLRIRRGAVEDPGSDTNFCAYLAVGVWHHLSITGNRGFAERMWPTVRDGIDFVLAAQHPRGEIPWALDTRGRCLPEALLTGCSSIHHSLRCALALAGWLGESRPDWDAALGRLGHALREHPEAFASRERYSMDWYYPVLGGAVRGGPAGERLRRRWEEFVVDGLGVRCVADHPWVTGAETCELVLSLDAVGWRSAALELFAAVQHLRENDGSYWTGLVYTDGRNWPVEHTTWTSAAMVLAADALSGTTPANGIFRAERLPGAPSWQDGPCGCLQGADLAADAS
ncbi:prenyltransferase [Actinopolyspora mortivallis]|uniref:Prenyltransferase n=1 Tax=Actinopolyspora mortivallis TaxID=33906 RepID=A0A2T0GT90_ACTMO|nr:prenyltransferase [Actinopolyspora mortivallis]PRW62314.1 prenyltransferase [Actinopolyspora mortivallis]